MLEPGSRLGPYEIVASIGAGGMGEVYLARDANLKRDVALKVLPAALAHDPERMARFRREAEVLASLNHPGIATIFGFEGDAIVMEMVPGDALRGPLSVAVALQYAGQIVDALEYAHDRGVIHRDLKPANIKVTPDGRVKLLDFGLAKAIEDPTSGLDPANSPTLTLGYTQAGTILGTAAYMSPEQAVGKPVDRRSDIFSFGAVLYEVLTGKQAFVGESAGDILAAVVKDEPDWDSLSADTPDWLRGLLRRCLIKDRRQRLQAIGEARLLLENPPKSDLAKPSAGPRFRIAGWVMAVIFAVVAGISLSSALRSTPPPPRLVTHHFTVPVSMGRYRVPGGIAFSRDGSRVAFVAGSQRQIFVRDMDQLDVKPIQGTMDAEFICFSPDGQWISYVAQGHLNKVAFAGGPVQYLAKAGARIGPPTQRWEPDGFIMFVSDGVLKRVPENGGKEETLATPDKKAGEAAFFSPQVLPGGKILLSSLGAVSRIIVLDPITQKKTILSEGPEGAQYAPDGGADSTVGRLIYFDQSSRSLMAAPFNVATLSVGAAIPIIERVRAGAGPFASYAFSPFGTLAYVLDNSVDGDSSLVWVNRKGEEQSLTAPLRRYAGDPRISPDGQKAAVLIGRPDLSSLGAGDIWVLELKRGSFFPVTHDATARGFVWSADGKRIIYSITDFGIRGTVGDSSRGSDSSPGGVSHLLAISADGVGTATDLAQRLSTTPLVPYSVARDNTLIGGNRGSVPNSLGRRNQSGELWLLPLTGAAGEAKVTTFRNFSYWVFNARISPDGHFIAYQSEDSGRFEIYAVPYPRKEGERVPVSAGGGTDPRWGPDGHELFYRNGDKLMVVDVLTGGKFGDPKLLFEKTGSYDVASDGRFLMIKPAAQPTVEARDEMHIVVNWFDELRRRVPLQPK
jgi:serine/threonine-protein kinase